MMMLDGGGVLLTPPITNNFTLSSASAYTIAEALKPLLQTSSIEKLLQWSIPLLTLCVAIATGFVAYYTYKISKHSFANAILKQFFDISMSFPMAQGATLSAHHKQLICNYFDFVCHLVERGQLDEKDVEPLQTVMKQPLFVDFMRRYRQGQGRNTLLDAYWRWHQKNR